MGGIEGFFHSWTILWSWLLFLFGIFNLVIDAVALIWVLTIKRDPTSALAWCMLIVFLPMLGPVLFFFLGYQHVDRPLRRKRRHKRHYQRTRVEGSAGRESVGDWPAPGSLGEGMARLATQFGAHPPTAGNELEMYYEGRPAFDAMLNAIRGAEHHVHLETFIFQPDATGALFLQELTKKASQGVHVRLLYDAMGSRRIRFKRLAELLAAQGKCVPFLPMNILRRRMQINMRNHRKICVVDGRIGFVGGMNVGDEYLGLVPRFGYWRDTHLRIRGPAVADLQHVFAEDWDFAAGERLDLSHTPHGESTYFPRSALAGPYAAQIIESGPDRELKGIRELYFAAILRAKKRVWIASPYFVPDSGLRDALRLAGHLGVDVRLLGLFQPDVWIPYFAARFYWEEMLQAGVKVYQYTRGMMHSKVVLVDGEWASVGTANLDNRSLHLNFEVNCLLHSPEIVQQLEQAFLRDLETSIRLEHGVYTQRPYSARLAENACRLLSPVL